MTQTDREPNYTDRYIHSDSQVFDEILFPSAEGAGKVSENIEKLRNFQKKPLCLPCFSYYPVYVGK